MGEGGMAADVVTVAESLKQAGYTTGLVGKWHLGYGGKSLPNDQGFDEFYGFRGGKIDYFNHTDSAQKVSGDTLGKHDFYDDRQEIFPKGYSTQLFTQRALRFIKRHAEEPFFLCLAYNAPHYARVGILQAMDEYLKRFSRGEQPTRRELYAAMVSCMDDGIGELLDYLQQSGLDQNTLVMFISDNGADPEHGGSNVPFSGGKWTFKEGGIRVPMIAQWPGHIQPGTTTREIIHGIDLFPTMLAAAGIARNQALCFDGINVLNALQGKSKLPERPLFFGECIVRKGNWKLANTRGVTALYDLEGDCTEHVNLASTHPDLVDELERLLKNHLLQFSDAPVF
jgi:arylsulfatase A-like enzyme